MMKNYGEEQRRVVRCVGGIPVKLILQKRKGGFDVEKPWWTHSLRTDYSPGGTNRQYYWTKDGPWHIPIKITLCMMNEMESLGGLCEGYSDHRWHGMQLPEYLVSTEMTAAERFDALEGITGPDEYWDAATFFVIIFDPNREWKKVLLINPEANIATFRSITESSSYKRKKVLRPDAGWWLDNTMMDANVQQMRVFHSQLKQYLSP